MKHHNCQFYNGLWWSMPWYDRPPCPPLALLSSNRIRRCRIDAQFGTISSPDIIDLGLRLGYVQKNEGVAFDLLRRAWHVMCTDCSARHVILRYILSSSSSSSLADRCTKGKTIERWVTVKIPTSTIQIKPPRMQDRSWIYGVGSVFWHDVGSRSSNLGLMLIVYDGWGGWVGS